MSADKITPDRVRGGHSLHDEEKPELCPGNRHAHWRAIACDGETDVVECSRCGRQHTERCSFDEDYS